MSDLRKQRRIIEFLKRCGGGATASQISQKLNFGLEETGAMLKKLLGSKHVKRWDKGNGIIFWKHTKNALLVK